MAVGGSASPVPPDPDVEAAAAENDTATLAAAEMAALGANPPPTPGEDLSKGVP